MDTNSILNVINNLVNTSVIKSPINYYLNGGCYTFAKHLQSLIGGELRYLTLEHHFIVNVNNKLFDITGNVTNKYKNSRYIHENDFIKRNKLKESIKLKKFE